MKEIREKVKSEWREERYLEKIKKVKNNRLCDKKRRILEKRMKKRERRPSKK